MMCSSPTTFAVETRLPIGVRFKPTDIELVQHYLHKKVYQKPLPAEAIPEIDSNELYSNPPSKLVGNNREKQWFFFIRYQVGDFDNTEKMVGEGEGFWKLMGGEDPICDMDGSVLAFKVLLYYFSGTSVKPHKTKWRMEVYRLPNIPDGSSYHQEEPKVEKLVVGRLQRG